MDHIHHSNDNDSVTIVDPYEKIKKEISKIRDYFIDNDDFMTFLSGVVTDGGSSLIEKSFLDKLWKRMEWIPSNDMTVSQILITCDPNCSDSATSADMALFAMINHMGSRVVSLSFIYLFSFCFLRCYCWLEMVILSPLGA